MIIYLFVYQFHLDFRLFQQFYNKIKAVKQNKKSRQNVQRLIRKIFVCVEYFELKLLNLQHEIQL